MVSSFSNMPSKHQEMPEMCAYDVMHNQTQSAINVLYVLVMSILPLLWFGDCKLTMSLLFKNIQLPSHYEERDTQIDFHANLQMLLVIVAIGVYWLHRRWRLRSHYQRSDELRMETSFTESKELHTLKQKLLDKINYIIEDKICEPLKQFAPSATKLCFSHRTTMAGILEEAPENNDSSDINIESQ